jgi:DNA-binding transcriptional LysR family regulator
VLFATFKPIASRTVQPRRLGDPVVTVELLAALDALIWLRTGERAAGHLRCTQSTVSRHSRRALEVFGLQMEKRAGEWCLLGDPTLLNLQRGVHQFLRWQQGSGLRLDSQHWCSHLLAAGLPDAWTDGNSNFFEYQRPLELLQQGVIDAWLCSAPDLPEHPDLHAVQLTATPMRLVVKPGHPLLDRGAKLCFADLADYPVMPLPDGAFPRAQEVLEELDLWSCPRRDRRFRQAAWFGQVPMDDLMIGFDTPLRLAAGLGDGWLPLPLALPLVVGEALVVKRAFAASPHLLALLEGLSCRASQLAQGLRDVELLWPLEPAFASLSPVGISPV